MRKNLYLDEVNKDLTLVNNNLRLTVNISEFVSQKIENVLKTIKGEFFANESLGLPYFTDILGKGRDLKAIGSIFKNAILSIEEISEILNFSLNFDRQARILYIDYSVLTTENVTIIGTVEV